MSLAWHIRLAGQAKQDLLDITLWTAENFGARQAEQYAETIALAIEASHDGPEILGAKVRDDIGAGIRTLHVARHGRKGAISWPSQYRKDTSSMSFDYCMTAWIWPSIFRKTTMNRIRVDQFNLASV